MKTKTLSNPILFIITLLSVLNLSAKTDLLIQEVSFESHEVEISGTLVLPNSDFPVPAMIMIHGSGTATRNIEYASDIAAKGIAVLTYDKRGCGSSGGEYEGKFNVTNKNLKLLADDAISGIQLLKSNKKIDQNMIGVWGISQAGWIAPIVATKESGVSYMVMLSCPTVPVPQELKYSEMAENDEDFFEKYTQEEIRREIEKFHFSDIFFKIVGYKLDPREYLKKLEIPVLWIFGEKDRSIPAIISMQEIEKMNKEHFSVKTDPDYGHFLRSADSNRTPSIQVDDLFIDWIKSLNK